MDIFALREGALGRPDVREAVLNRISPEALRAQAAGLLDQVEAALNQRMVQDVVQEPLKQIVDLLSASSVDGQKLKEQLIILHTGLAMLDVGETKGTTPIISSLDIHLRSVSPKHLKVLLKALHPANKLRAAHKALAPFTDGSEKQARAMLDHLRTSLGRTIHEQAQPGLAKMRGTMAQAAQAKNRVLASQVLYQLSCLTGKAQLAYGPLPEDMVEDVRKLVKDGLALIRRPEANPEGLLSAACLSRLDDSSLGAVRLASKVLQPMGLELDHKAAKAIGLQRVEALSQQIADDMAQVFRRLSGEPVDMSMLIRQLRDLSGLEWQRVQRLTALGQFAGGVPSPDEWRATVKRTCELAVEELSRTSSRVLILHNAIVHIDLLAELEGIFGRIASRLEKTLVQEGYSWRRMETMQQIITTRYLLAGIAGEMAQKMSGLLSGQGSSDGDIDLYVELVSRMILNAAAGTQPGSLYSALREHYGVAYDPWADEVALLRMEPPSGQGSS